MAVAHLQVMTTHKEMTMSPFASSADFLGEDDEEGAGRKLALRLFWWLPAFGLVAMVLSRLI
jgi:hypothetical protein